MRYRERRPTYATVQNAQEGAHYAAHVDQPEGPHLPLVCVPPAELERLREATTPDEARGVPEAYHYEGGVLHVWPAPAEGWQVWRALDGKNVTPQP